MTPAHHYVTVAEQPLKLFVVANVIGKLDRIDQKEHYFPAQFEHRIWRKLQFVKWYDKIAVDFNVIFLVSFMSNNFEIQFDRRKKSLTRKIK